MKIKNVHYTKLVNNKEKEIYNAKINFFTNITHEIRTPLTLIKLPIDKIISSKRYTPESEKDLRTIQANTDRLLSLTNQILDMRKMERNEMKLSFIKEDLCTIVKKAISLFEQMAQEQRITMTINITDNPLEIMCAKDSVLTIITNLLSNAVKYGKDHLILHRPQHPHRGPPAHCDRHHPSPHSPCVLYPRLCHSKRARGTAGSLGDQQNDLHLKKSGHFVWSDRFLFNQ